MLKLTIVALMLYGAGKAKPKAPPPGPPDPCSADKLKLGEVKKLIPFDLPKDCGPRPPAIRVFVRTEKEFGERMTCAEAAVKGVDFKKHMLIAMKRNNAAGTVGTDIYDERGQKVTFVSRFKGACPGEKQEASEAVIAFLMDTDPVPPEFGEATCNLPANCGK